MKTILAKFEISSNKTIEIYFPNSENKFNYYSVTSEKIDKFDQATIDYRDNNQTLNLYNDELGDGVLCLSNQIKRSLVNYIELPHSLEIGNMGYALNESEMSKINLMYSDINFKEFWIWSSIKGPQTFMYTRNSRLYLEIGLIYPWVYKEPLTNDPNYFSYNEFIKNYRPLVIEEITKNIATSWLKKCNILLEKLNNHR